MARGGRKKQYGGGRRKYGYKRGIQIRQPVQYFTRTAFYGSLFTVGTSAPAPAVSQFSLNQVPNFSEMTQLYDQYQIKAIKYTLIPKFTNNELNIGGGASAGILGNVWSVLDYDDSTTPLTLQELLQYQNIKRTRQDKVHKRYFKPKVAQTIGSNISPKANVWLDCNTASTPHFGVKLWFDALAGVSNTNITFDLVVKYYMAFKNVR